jgi:hypothetical protein
MEQDEPQDAPSEAAGEAAVADEVGGAEPVELSADDGGDVAGRDPDAIAREIEQTRAELADTIDAIADRISPKRAASRGAQAVKAQVASAREKVAGDQTPPSDLADTSSGASGPPSEVSNPLAAIAPKAAVAGVVLLIVVFLLRRRSR